VPKRVSSSAVAGVGAREKARGRKRRAREGSARAREEAGRWVGKFVTRRHEGTKKGGGGIGRMGEVRVRVSGGEKVG
jgi:hypothetical protein